MPFHIFDKMADKLCVRRELLDPNFDGYKLSLDPLPTYTCKFDNGSNTLLQCMNVLSFVNTGSKYLMWF